MATGLPVVVSDTAENSRWVEHGRGGFIVPAADPEALAARVVELAHDVAQRKAMGAHNPTVIAARNNVKVEMKKMNELYARIGGIPHSSRD